MNEKLSALLHELLMVSTIAASIFIKNAAHQAKAAQALQIASGVLAQLEAKVAEDAPPSDSTVATGK